MQEFDVIVVGAGNAALAAAVSARDSGARKVLVLEKAPREARGGNTHFSGGIFRFAFDRIEQAIDLVPNLDEGWPEFRTGADPYPARDFHSDLMRVTGGQSDPELANLIISNSYPLMQWMRDVAKMPFEPARAFGGEAVKGKDSLEGVRTGMGVRWQPGDHFHHMFIQMHFSTDFWIEIKIKDVQFGIGKCSTSALISVKKTLIFFLSDHPEA